MFLHSVARYSSLSTFPTFCTTQFITFGMFLHSVPRNSSLSACFWILHPAIYHCWYVPAFCTPRLIFVGIFLQSAARDSSLLACSWVYTTQFTAVGMFLHSFLRDPLTFCRVVNTLHYFILFNLSRYCVVLQK